MVTREKFKKLLDQARSADKALTIVNLKKSEYRVRSPIAISDEGVEFSTAGRIWVKLAWAEIQAVTVG